MFFSTLEIQFLFFKNEFREGTYTPCGVLVVLHMFEFDFFFTNRPSPLRISQRFDIDRRFLIVGQPSAYDMYFTLSGNSIAIRVHTTSINTTFHPCRGDRTTRICPTTSALYNLLLPIIKFIFPKAYTSRYLFTHTEVLPINQPIELTGQSLPGLCPKTRKLFLVYNRQTSTLLVFVVPRRR